VDISLQAAQILERLGVEAPFVEGGDLECRSPIDGGLIGTLQSHTTADAGAIVGRAHEAFQEWRVVPAPVRGQLVRELGELLRKHKEELGTLVSVEAGKVISEGLGEVQEMIDICDFAVGLSRQLHGVTMSTERPGHRMMEQWHPLGVVSVISAFNFPVAVWSWNAALALVCGDAVVWKPSEKTLLTALACHALLTRAAHRVGAPAGLFALVLGTLDVGRALVEDRRVPLVSATGSTRMGKDVSPRVAARLGRSLLELGGNNAALVTRSADLDLAVRAIVFAAVGTAGQRCTSLRRIIVHESIKQDLLERLSAAYEQLSVGSPLDPSHLVGPLIDDAVDQAQQDGGILLTGGHQDVEASEATGGGCYVRPAIIDMPVQTDIVRSETFAPVLYVLTYSGFDDALRQHNDVTQGLSSSIFTLDVREAETFLSVVGSDCGIANVNIGPSGAEIGGAFGGEKDTGGGRESGSDAWKNYMRRATNTVNFSTELPLAQGVQFL
jgi:aldehyde dehydrogenase (NAD+)